MFDEKNMPKPNSTTPRTEEEMNLILAGLNIPYKKGSIGKLGGENRACMSLWFSLDPQEEWSNGIYHNSCYFIFMYDCYGKLELISGGSMFTKEGGFHKFKKFRKCSPKNAQNALERLQTYLFEVTDERMKIRLGV